MVDTQKFDKIIDRLETIAQDQQLSVFDSACMRIKRMRDDFDLKVLFVGHFSAGKSALLNELIGRGEVLKEGQPPTTARIREIRAEDFPGSGLDALKDITLVDTPGLDSDIPEHDEALTKYMGMGGGYVVLISREKGGLDDATLACIEEVASYTSNVAVVFSQCDKSGNESQKAVIEKAKKTLEERGFDFPVFAVSRFDNDIVKKLQSIILAFDGQGYFDQRMLLTIQIELPMLQATLDSALRKLTPKTWTYEADIRALKLARRVLQQDFEAQKKECEEDFEKQLQIIMNDIEGALLAKSDLCADMILVKDTQALEAIILNAIRPVLIHHLRTTTSTQIDSFVGMLNFSCINDMKLKKNLEDCFISLARSTQDLINSGVLGQALSAFEKIDDKKKQENEKKNEYYKMATGITAVLTDVVNPWIEVAIVLLPEIISLGKALLGPSDHDIARKNYQKRVTNVLLGRLYPHVENALRKASEALLKSLEEECTRQLEEYDTQMKQLEQDKQRSIAETEKRENTLKDSRDFINTLQEITRKPYIGSRHNL